MGCYITIYKSGIMYAEEWFLIGIVLYSARIALSKYRNKKISKEEDEKISIETYDRPELMQ